MADQLRLYRESKTDTQISDPFIDKKRCVDRLLREFREHGHLIIAYDYDNTVYDYHKKGYIFERVVALLRECYSLGFHLVVFTSCNEDRLPEIGRDLTKRSIPFHAINESPEYVPFKGRKVFYNHFLDDRAGLAEAVEILEDVVVKVAAELRANKALFKEDGSPIDEIA